MPTRGRQGWAADAVRMFKEQTYPAKELVIIDDMMERSFPLGVDGDGIQYHIAPRLTIGAKRNLAVSRSAGDIIAHWDSDDVYSVDRLAFQAAMLTADLELVGFNQMEFVDTEGAGRWMYHASDCFPIGVSMVYWRSTWDARHFPDVNTGEDVQFGMGRKVRCVPADGRIIARVHGGNTSEKRGPIAQNPQQWQRVA
jgi:glycosyltransferase involved in cell wall biosynthesis